LAHWAQPQRAAQVASWLEEQTGYTDIRLMIVWLQDEKDGYSRTFSGEKSVNITKLLRSYGTSLEDLYRHLMPHAVGEAFYPDEIWITSIHDLLVAKHA